MFNTSSARKGRAVFRCSAHPAGPFEHWYLGPWPLAERTKNNQQYYQCLTCRSCVRFLVAVANRDKQRTQKRQCHPISTGQPNLRFPDLGFDCLIIMGVGCWLVGGWLVVVCLSFVVACCRDIQYPPRLQTAQTRATHTHTHTLRTHVVL